MKTEDSIEVGLEEFGSSASVGSIDSFFPEDDDIVPEDSEVKEEEEPIKEPEEADEPIEESSEELSGKKKEVVDFEDDGGDDDEPVVKSGSDLIDMLLQGGILSEDLVLEDEEGNEIPITEADLDEEETIGLINKVIEERVSSELADKVSTKGISDFTKKLIEIEKNGGNVQQALETYNTYKSPMDEIDISDKDGQVDAIYLTLSAKGLSDDDITSLIETYDTNGELEERAKKAKKDLDIAFEKQMEKINQEAIDRKNEYKDFVKKYSEDIKKEISGSFQLRPELVNKLVDISSKEGNDGRFEMDKIYQDIRRDPKRSAALTLFLLDKEEYDRQVSSKKVDETNKKTFAKFKLTRGGGDTVKPTLKKKRRGETDLSEFL